MYMVRDEHEAQQMIPLSRSSEGGLFDDDFGWHRRHSPMVSLLQHVGSFCWLSLVWYFFTISFTCVLRSSSSSYNILRQTFGVVGASGNKEIDMDFSKTNFAATDGLWWMFMVDGALSFASEFSLSSSSFSATISSALHSSTISTTVQLLSVGIVKIVTLLVCTTRTSDEWGLCGWRLSTLSHLWFMHSDTSRRSLKERRYF